MRNFLKAENGYELHSDYRRQGIMTGISKEVVCYGFKQMGLNWIETFYDPDNPASG
ncbi:GNAT family N-acetyltransferase [Cytobacillus sp. NCCP-133]|uniref:GNAT family N-acetyltransferase n=1 Tax=Cytobacillus sp. NCCP-133 TaxID=766848 RepID=UPI0022308957|nr:GNAT family N-acetyltransferase [Cytobacillus sp. NCCP-133]GLB61985.1 hypothetical protein NCCP133_41140 [Cytobacillus sp. NCCP-133]